jgi:hypothetical protein
MKLHNWLLVLFGLAGAIRDKLSSKADNKECPDCGEVMEVLGPKELILLKIPLTSVEIRVWNWNSGELGCWRCAEEDANNWQDSCVDDALMQASLEGYNQGYIDGQHG